MNSTYRKIEDLCEEQDQQRVEEVDCLDGDVERICLLVHVRSHDGDSNQHTGINNDEANSLCDTASLAKSNEQTLDQDVSKSADDEVIHGGLELDVQEAPLVQSLWIRIEDVSWVLVHLDGSLSDTPDLDGGPAEDGKHGNDCADCEDDFTGRVALGHLPEAENDHLWEANEDLQSVSTGL